MLVPPRRKALLATAGDGLPGGTDDERVNDLDTDDLPTAWGEDAARMRQIDRR